MYLVFILICLFLFMECANGQAANEWTQALGQARGNLPCLHCLRECNMQVIEASASRQDRDEGRHTCIVQECAEECGGGGGKTAGAGASNAPIETGGSMEDPAPPPPRMQQNPAVQSQVEVKKSSKITKVQENGMQKPAMPGGEQKLQQKSMPKKVAKAKPTGAMVNKPTQKPKVNKAVKLQKTTDVKIQPKKLNTAKQQKKFVAKMDGNQNH